MTTLEKKPQAQSSYQPTQTGNESGSRQVQQQQPKQTDSRGNPERNQSGQQQEQSFTISADDFMML